jgi:hypothetical protein
MIQANVFRRSTVSAFVTGCLLFSLPGCAPVETAIIAEPGVSFALPVGQTVSVKGTDTRLTFSEVREDSRCPTDVTCVWAADAKIRVVVSRIRFVGLAPVPRQADANVPRSYVAQFVVDKL